MVVFAGMSIPPAAAGSPTAADAEMRQAVLALDFSVVTAMQTAPAGRDRSPR